MKYSLSFYNYTKTLDNDRTLIWNTYTGSLFILENIEYIELCAQKGKTFNNNLDLYLKSGILTDVSLKNSQFDNIMKHRKIIYQAYSEISFRILPTTACNARCPYCYEKDINIKNMSYRDADAIISFITLKAQNFKRINILWFGGEPLLAQDKISYITKKLMSLNLDKEFYFDMTTNGILFDKQTAKKAKEEWHISEIQISLDGTKNIYENTKNYIAINNSFDLICNNIENLVKTGIHVIIRLNTNKSNYQDLIELIYLLHNKFSNAIEVYAYPIFPTKKFAQDIIKTNEMVSYMGDILLALKENGYIERIISFKKTVLCACSSVLPYNFVILPNGELIKCSSEIGQDNCIIGSVQNDIVNTKRADAWSNYELDECCKNCCFLPICQGGCLASKYCESSTLRCCLDKYLLDGLIDRFYKDELV